MSDTMLVIIVLILGVPIMLFALIGSIYCFIDMNNSINSMSGKKKEV